MKVIKQRFHLFSDEEVVSITNIGGNMEENEAMLENTEDIRLFLEILKNVIVEYLSKCNKIKTRKVIPDFNGQQEIKELYMTAMITVEDRPQFEIMVTFDQKVVVAMLDSYSADLSYEKEEVEMMLEETGLDMLNIAVGKTLGIVNHQKIAFKISPPKIVKNIEVFLQGKSSQVFGFRCITTYGDVIIYGVFS